MQDDLAYLQSIMGTRIEQSEGDLLETTPKKDTVRLHVGGTIKEHKHSVVRIAVRSEYSTR